MRVWYCRDAFGNQRLLEQPCGGADSAEGCGWKRLVPVDSLILEKIDGQWVITDSFTAGEED